MSDDSDLEAETSQDGLQSRDGWKTLAWIFAFLIAIELGLSILLSVPAIENSGIGRYFGHGSSTETKIRGMATDPNLAPNAVFYAGWLDLEAWPTKGEVNERADIVVYGMSYAGRLTDALWRVAPDLEVQMIGGPGVPISHSYAAYGMLKSEVSSKVVIISLLPRGTGDMASMTHDTSFIDHSQPSNWPIYQRTTAPDGEISVEVKAWPVINSAKELRRAVTEDPALWEKHLAMLEASDQNFSRFLYASHWSENFVMGRVLRRAWAKSFERGLMTDLMGTDDNFNPSSKPAQLTRDVLRTFIRDVRAKGEKPVVMLFSQPGSRDRMYQLVSDVLKETQVDYFTSEDFCDSTVSDHYQNKHFISRCDDAMAKAVVGSLKDVLGGEPELPAPSSP